jgi:hypothetical protein
VGVSFRSPQPSFPKKSEESEKSEKSLYFVFTRPVFREKKSAISAISAESPLVFAFSQCGLRLQFALSVCIDTV